MARHRGHAALAVVALLAAAWATAAQATTICDVQDYDSEGFSPLLGGVVAVRGIVTVPPGIFQPQYTSMYVQQGDCGVNVFCFEPLALSIGDSVEVTGVVEEYISSGSGAVATTELFCDSPSQIVLLSSGHPEPEPAELSIADVAKEDSEGRFVRTIGIVIENNFDYSMYLGDPWSGASVQVYSNFNENIDFTGFVPGDTLEVTGVVLQYDRSAPFFDGYELVPRYQSDMRFAEPPPPGEPVYWTEAQLAVSAAPFRPDVGEILPIAYSAPGGSRTRIEIYDLQGRVVRTLVDDTYDGQSRLPEFYRDGFYGEGVRGWDGRDVYRCIVPAGTYICRLEVDDEDGVTSVATAPAIVGVRLK